MILHVVTSYQTFRPIFIAHQHVSSNQKAWIRPCSTATRATFPSQTILSMLKHRLKSLCNSWRNCPMNFSYPVTMIIIVSLNIKKFVVFYSNTAIIAIEKMPWFAILNYTSHVIFYKQWFL